MPRIVRCGLIQAASPITDPAVPIADVREAAIAAHIPFIEEAGRRGVQILGLQEVFNGPYFCPSQDAHWYDLAEPVPGPTTEAMAAYARKYQMAMVMPVYEREQAGVYYNTAAVIDADGSYLGKYRKNHIPHTAGSGRSTSSSRATSATRCSRRATRRSASTSVTTATFPKARACSA